MPYAEQAVFSQQSAHYSFSKFTRIIINNEKATKKYNRE